MAAQSNQSLETAAYNRSTATDRIFHDSQGQLVIAQWPNLPIVLASSTTLLSLVLPNSPFKTILELVAFGTWYTWAWLELFQGVNYFRRGLGALVLAGLISLPLLGR
jgi:hypothetical protein